MTITLDNGLTGPKYIEFLLFSVQFCAFLTFYMKMFHQVPLPKSISVTKIQVYLSPTLAAVDR
jgi:hypothetical protein